MPGSWSSHTEKSTKIINLSYMFFVIHSNLLPSGLVLNNLPAMQEIQVQSLGQEDPLKKEMATHTSILAWEIPKTEEPSRLWSMGSQKSWTQLSD